MANLIKRKKKRFKCVLNFNFFTILVVVLILVNTLIHVSLEDTQPITNEQTEVDNVPYNKKTLPSFILHVGPLKTGTTSLQCTLTSLRSELEKDGYRYIGIIDNSCGPPSVSEVDDQVRLREERIFKQALVQPSPCEKKLVSLKPPPKNVDPAGDDGDPGPISDYGCWGDFVSLLEKYRHKGISIIYSEENISNYMTSKKNAFPFQHLQRALVGWDVQVLITHRRLYNWIPSLHNEVYKQGPNKHRLKKWPGVGLCVKSKGKIMSTVLAYASDIISVQSEYYPHAVQVAKMVRSGGLPITLETYERPGSIVSRMICSHGASTACRTLTTSGLIDSLPRSNPSVSLDYDYVAVAACITGLINGSIVTREEASEYIQEFIQGVEGASPLSLPHNCPARDDLMPILEASLKDEQAAFKLRDKEWGQKEREVHEIAFWNDTGRGEHDGGRKKYCLVDFGAIQEEAGWKKFFTKTMMSRKYNKTNVMT